MFQNTLMAAVTTIGIIAILVFLNLIRKKSRTNILYHLESCVSVQFVLSFRDDFPAFYRAKIKDQPNRLLNWLGHILVISGAVMVVSNPFFTAVLCAMGLLVWKILDDKIMDQFYVLTKNHLSAAGRA